MKMYKLSITEEFDAAHQLELPYKSKCKNVHGHRWKVEVTVGSDKLNESGMVVDFSILKGHVRELIESFDHHFINDIIKQPTSENIAKFFYDDLKDHLADAGVKLLGIKIWETPTSCCSYEL